MTRIRIFGLPIGLYVLFVGLGAGLSLGAIGVAKTISDALRGNVLTIEVVGAEEPETDWEEYDKDRGYHKEC